MSLRGGEYHQHGIGCQTMQDIGNMAVSDELSVSIVTAMEADMENFYL
jgi:hypothetical protein